MADFSTGTFGEPPRITTAGVADTPLVDPAGTDATGQPLTAAQNSALAYLKNILAEYGLEDLAGWAADELKKGYDDTIVLQHLREQPLFKERFKVIFDRQEQGLPAISPAQVIEYERTAAQLMGRFGMPQGFYDTPSDFHDLLMRDVSPQELQFRLESGYGRVMQAPQEVRDVFKDFFGAGSDQALATFFLDPEKAQPVLEKQLNAALDAGVGRRYGFNMSYDEASRLSAIGIDPDAAAKGFFDLGTQKGLYDENVGENLDLRAEREGVGATFGIDPESRRKVERRQQERQAQFGGGGGALEGQQGVAGLGTADK